MSALRGSAMEVQLDAVGDADAVPYVREEDDGLFSSLNRIIVKRIV